MKRLFDFLRAVFISPEIVWILFIVGINLYFNDIFLFLGQRFKSNGEIWKYLPTLPIFFSGVAFTFGGKLRIPFDSPNNKKLYEWPEYSFLITRIYVCFFLCILSCIGALSVWILTDRIQEKVIAFIFLGSVGVSGISAFTIYIASHRIREILERYL
jgi:hypothetical protein